MFKFPPTPRQTNVLILLACSAMIAIALALQHWLDLHPFPLCITQRIFVMAVGALALLAVLHNPARLGQQVYAGLQALMALAGALVAARHTWIQHLPDDQVPACGPGLSYMFANFPLSEALTLLFRGDGNCHIVDWTFLGLSIPEMVLIACTGLFAVNGWQLVRRS